MRTSWWSTLALFSSVTLTCWLQNLVDCRPHRNLGGKIRWSQINQRSAPSVFTQVHGSRFGLPHQYTSSMFPVAADPQANLPHLYMPFEEAGTDHHHLRSPLDVLDATETFLKSIKHDHRMHPKEEEDTLFDHLEEPSRHHQELEDQLTKEDEEFLLNSLAQGLDLQTDFEKLLYPRGDDGFQMAGKRSRAE